MWENPEVNKQRSNKQKGKTAVITESPTKTSRSLQGNHIKVIKMRKKCYKTTNGKTANENYKRKLDQKKLYNEIDESSTDEDAKCIILLRLSIVSI